MILPLSTEVCDADLSSALTTEFQHKPWEFSAQMISHRIYTCRNLMLSLWTNLLRTCLELGGCIQLRMQIFKLYSTMKK